MYKDNLYVPSLNCCTHMPHPKKPPSFQKGKLSTSPFSTALSSSLFNSLIIQSVHSVQLHFYSSQCRMETLTVWGLTPSSESKRRCRPITAQEVEGRGQPQCFLSCCSSSIGNVLRIDQCFDIRFACRSVCRLPVVQLCSWIRGKTSRHVHCMGRQAP